MDGLIDTTWIIGMVAQSIRSEGYITACGGSHSRIIIEEDKLWSRSSVRLYPTEQHYHLDDPSNTPQQNDPVQDIEWIVVSGYHPQTRGQNFVMTDPNMDVTAMGDMTIKSWSTG